MEETKVNRLAGYIINIGIIAAISLVCWYFSDVLLYVVLAFVVSLIGQPLVTLFAKVKIKGKAAPDWLLAILALAVIFLGGVLLVTQVIPVISGIIRDASLLSDIHMPSGNILEGINGWVVSVVPGIDPSFDAVHVLLDYLKGFTSGLNVSGFLGSMASAVAGLAVGLFSVAFISFFFVKDQMLFRKIVSALTPDHLEEKVSETVSDIEHLLSRYFVGLIIEMLGVALIDFLGLWLIARVGFGYAIGIAFIAGILNIIPYIGPLIGEVLGVLLCVIIKYGTGAGLDVNIWVFALVVLAIMLTAQLVDNFVYQPLIYSKSIQATPLEIFIVILVAGHIGGALGMLAAIPAYTVVRVIASKFFHDKKPVRRLIPE